MKNWIRVGCDTGGIAAGADKVISALEAEKASQKLDVKIVRVGSLGLSFADPLVEVGAEGMPTVLYGNVNEVSAKAIATDHLGKKKLVEDCVVASRKRGTAIAQKVAYILVKDTASSGGDKTEYIQTSIVDELKRQGVEGVQVVRMLDAGIYDRGIVVQVLPSEVTYVDVKASDIARIVTETVKGAKVVKEILFSEADKQIRVVLRNCGIIDPENIDDYIAQKGYEALKKCFAIKPEGVIEEMKTSGLRGRGGAGFPTWLKWKLTREVQNPEKFVICNADEGDPGAFMDRSVLESDPHSVLEGMLIAAYTMGASMGYFYIRAEYPCAIARVEKAIAQARERGLLGDNIMGSGFSFNAKVRLGAGAFVCGEETALIASIEGKRGSPTPRPPFPSVKGLFGKSTAINNVETLASVPAIINMGGAEYSKHGTDKSKGTKVFAVTGKVKNAQLVEVPMGTTLHDVIYKICGGVQDAKPIKAVQTGGPSGGVIPEQHLDTPISYENLQQLGSIMGSGGMLVMDKNDCMVDVTKFYLKFCVDESCGKCAPCRVGGFQLLQLLEKISKGRGSLEDIEMIRKICVAMQKASLCGLGQTAPNPVLSTLRYFESEYKAYIDGGAVYARKMAKILAGEAPSPAAPAATNK